MLVLAERRKLRLRLRENHCSMVVLQLRQRSLDFSPMLALELACYWALWWLSWRALEVACACSMAV
jgi:hypothetical protein